MIEIEELRVIMQINYLFLGVEKNNILGYEGEAFYKKMEANIKPILDRFLDFYWILKLGDNVKVKTYSTSYQKLMKFFNLWAITKQLFFSFLKVYFFRYLEVRVKKVNIDLDRYDHKHTPEREKLQEYLKKSRANAANVKYFAYFCPDHRKNVIGFELTEVKVKLKFHQSELFHIEMESNKGHLYMTHAISNK